MILLALLVAIALFLSIGLWRTQQTAAKFSKMSWHELVEQLQPVSTQGIDLLATAYLNPGKKVDLDTPDLDSIVEDERFPRSYDDLALSLLGGTSGLSRMRHNVDVMIALAAYAKSWSGTEGAIAAERIRRDGQVIKRAIVGLGLGKTTGYGKARVSSYISQAAAAYYLMRQRLLALYQNSHAGLYPQLGEAFLKQSSSKGSVDTKEAV